MLRINATKFMSFLISSISLDIFPCPMTREERMETEKSEAFMHKLFCVVEFISSLGFWYCILVELVFIVVSKFEN